MSYQRISVTGPRIRCEDAAARTFRAGSYAREDGGLESSV
jgi:hypothetical protein